MMKSTSFYSARTIAERLEEERKSDQEMRELAAAYRERTGQRGPIRFVDYLPEPDAELVAQAIAERAARREARLAERPRFIPAPGRSWDDLSEEALSEVNLANRALNAARRIAGGSLAVRYHANEYGDEALAEATEQQWLADEQAWLSAEEALHEVLVKHGLREEDVRCAPSLAEFDPGTQVPSRVIDTVTGEVSTAA